ncbi:hypothetical protein [Runella sp.]|uniref:hypothetical protein n=1 Tax=Runella sp. TaxID=1960881 RepID=UPI003D0F2FE5
MEIIYEWILGEDEDADTYRELVFQPVFLITIGVCLVLALVFYVGLGRWKPVFHKTIHWVIMLLIAFVFAFVFAINQALDATEADEYDNYMYSFGAVNVGYTFILFCLFSLLFKRFSIHAKYTPF